MPTSNTDANPGVPSFIGKTYDIFSAPPYDECCEWGTDGKTIVIKKIDVFAQNILPKFFKHSNFQSFVRQLHIYDFHKTSTLDPNHVGYANEFFRQGRPDLLSHIRRKANTHPNKPASTSNGHITGHHPAAATSSSGATAKSTVVADAPNSRLSSHHGDTSKSSSSSSAAAVATTTTSKKSSSSLKSSSSTSSANVDELAHLRQENQMLKQNYSYDVGVMEQKFNEQLSEHERYIDNLRHENRRLREALTHLRGNQNKISAKWEKLLEAIYGLFVQSKASGTSGEGVEGIEQQSAFQPPANWTATNFDFNAFKTLMDGVSDEGKAFVTSIESDARDILALSNSPALQEIEAEQDLPSFMSSPLRRDGMPLSYSFSFDTAASRVAAPSIPPVPRWTEPEPAVVETIGGGAMSKQSSFELFSHYVTLFGQPVDTSQTSTSTSSAVTTTASSSEHNLPLSLSKRPFSSTDIQPQTESETKKSRGDVGDEGVTFSSPQPSATSIPTAGLGAAMNLPSNYLTTPMELTAETRFNSTDTVAILGIGSPSLSLSRLNSIDFALNGSMDSELNDKTE